MGNRGFALIPTAHDAGMSRLGQGKNQKRKRPDRHLMQGSIDTGARIARESLDHPTINHRQSLGKQQPQTYGPSKMPQLAESTAYGFGTQLRSAECFHLLPEWQ